MNIKGLISLIFAMQIMLGAGVMNAQSETQDVVLARSGQSLASIIAPGTNEVEQFAASELAPAPQPCINICMSGGSNTRWRRNESSSLITPALRRPTGNTRTTLHVDFCTSATWQ